MGLRALVPKRHQTSRRTLSIGTSERSSGKDSAPPHRVVVDAGHSAPTVAETWSACTSTERNAARRARAGWPDPALPVLAKIPRPPARRYRERGGARTGRPAHGMVTFNGPVGHWQRAQT